MVFKTVSATTRKEKVVFSVERFLESINVWVLIYCFFVLDAYVLFDEDQERERTTTAIDLGILDCACVLHCACVCVGRVNFLVLAIAFMYVITLIISFGIDLSPDGLECLIIEITNPHSKPFLVGTWYRPPDSLASKFIDFEDIIAKIDLENRELFLLGDINVDLLLEVEAPSARKLKDILDVYGLHQLIAEPTRVTQFSQTLIDLCITNSPLSIGKSGVVQLSISDHALVYMTRKARYDRCGARIIQACCMKSFNESEFLEDLKQKAWNDSSYYSNPNDMWKAWKDCLMECINTHAPLRHIRVGSKKYPSSTDILRNKKRKRDLLKSKAASTNDPSS